MTKPQAIIRYLNGAIYYISDNVRAIFSRDSYVVRNQDMGITNLFRRGEDKSRLVKLIKSN